MLITLPASNLGPVLREKAPYPRGSPSPLPPTPLNPVGLGVGYKPAHVQ